MISDKLIEYIELRLRNTSCFPRNGLLEFLKKCENDKKKEDEAMMCNSAPLGVICPKCFTINWVDGALLVPEYLNRIIQFCRNCKEEITDVVKKNYEELSEFIRIYCKISEKISKELESDLDKMFDLYIWKVTMR